MRGAAARALDLVRAGLGQGGGPAPAMAPESALEGLDGLLFARAVGAGRPARVPTAWRESHAATAAHNLLALQGLTAALAALDDEPVVLPGAALLRLYPDLGCRPMDDVDILAPPGRKGGVLAGLARAGLRASGRHPDLMCAPGLTVDVHEDPLNSDRIRARRRAGWLDPVAAWTGRRRVDLDGRPVLALGSEDEVLYTAAHALRHSYRRLIWLVDLRLQLQAPELDWGLLRERAQATGLRRPLAYGLALLDRIGPSLPEPASAWLRSASLRPSTPRLLGWILGNRGRTCAGEVLWCLSCPTLGDRLRLLGEFAFPRTDVLLQVFPGLPRGLAPLAHALRCGQVLTRTAAELAAMARGGSR